MSGLHTNRMPLPKAQASQVAQARTGVPTDHHSPSWQENPTREAASWASARLGCPGTANALATVPSGCEPGALCASAACGRVGALSHCPSPAQSATRSVCQEAGQAAFSSAVRWRPAPSIRCVSTRRAGGRCGWQGAVARRVPESPCPCLPSEAALQGCQPQQQHRQQLRAQQQQRPELWRRQQRQQHLQLRLHTGRGGCPHGGHCHPQPVHALPRDAAEPARQATGSVRGTGTPLEGAGTPPEGAGEAGPLAEQSVSRLCGMRPDQRMTHGQDVAWPLRLLRVNNVDLLGIRLFWEQKAPGT